MINSNVFGLINFDGNISNRNYHAMSFYLIDAFELGLRFSLVDYAEDDGISYKDIVMNESIINMAINGDGVELQREKTNSKCLICGGKLHYEYSEKHGQNITDCGSKKCDDVIRCFSYQGWVKKLKTGSPQIKKASKISGVTPTIISEMYRDGEYAECVSLAMVSVFSEMVIKESTLLSSAYISIEKVSAVCGVLRASLLKGARTGRLYNADFPSVEGDDCKLFVTLSGINKWIDECDRQINRIEK